MQVVHPREGLIELQDGSLWAVTMLSSVDYKTWKPKDRLKIYYEPGFFYDQVMIENRDRAQKASAYIKLWPEQEKQELISKIPGESVDLDFGKKIITSKGYIFAHETCAVYINKWKVEHPLFIYHGSQEGIYDIYNLEKNECISGWRLIGNDGDQNIGSFENRSLKLEKFLNERVIAQEHATKTVSRAIINYAAGLKDAKTPVGTFLFLGPTGVGKTELAKVLCLELFKDYSNFIRFDMSQFSESHSISRLIGSPPGYVNHEEGGELTNALRKTPHCVILLDEIEKAHPIVQKAFLPVFDEGYITDNKGRVISCRNALFIMTSNLCSEMIIDYKQYELEPDDILELIEPHLIKSLSPELYNRLDPVVFNPLNSEAMGPIVDLMLREVASNLQRVKQIHLKIDETVRQYLIEKGYHPKLGARPLKRLIKNTVTVAIATAILEQRLSPGSTIDLFYDENDNSWYVSLVE